MVIELGWAGNRNGALLGRAAFRSDVLLLLIVTLHFSSASTRCHSAS